MFRKSLLVGIILAGTTLPSLAADGVNCLRPSISPSTIDESVSLGDGCKHLLLRTATIEDLVGGESGGNPTPPPSGSEG